MKVISLLITALLFVVTVQAQDFVEVRAGFTRDGMAYRYIDYNHTLDNNVVVDVAHYGSPGQNELWLGAGYNVKNEKFSAVFAGYVVAGKENKQLGLAVSSFGSGKVGKANVAYQTYAFVPLRGNVPKYLAVDSLDITANLSKKTELGISTGAYLVGNKSNLLAGPVFRLNDSKGSTSVSVRFGAYTEVRIGRTFNFNLAKLLR